MSINKYRIVNKYRLAVILISLLSMILYWFFNSGVYEVTIGFNPNAPDIRPGTASEAQRMLLSDILTLSKYMNTIGYGTTIFPVILFSTVLFFYSEKKGLFSFRYMRGESQKKVIISTILQHSIINAFFFYFIYLIYFNIGYLFIGPKMSNIPRNTFDGLFGQSFCTNHTYLYYIIQGIPSYFIGSFVYTLMACSIALFCRKVYRTIIVMLTYYWLLLIVIEFLRKQFMNSYLAGIWGMFEPTYIFGYYGYVYHNPSVFTILQIMSSLLIPLIVSIVLITISLAGKEKLYE